MAKTLYLVEGETEVALVRHFINVGSLPSGKVEVFNLWEKDISTIARKFSGSGNEIYVIFDMDVLTGLPRFNKNLAKIVKMPVVKKLHLMPQTFNLEGELTYACSCRQNNLLDAYGAQGKAEFKNKFIKAKGHDVILKRLNLDISKLWSRVTISNIVVPKKKTEFYHP